MGRNRYLGKNGPFDCVQTGAGSLQARQCAVSPEGNSDWLGRVVKNINTFRLRRWCGVLVSSLYSVVVRDIDRVLVLRLWYGVFVVVRNIETELILQVVMEYQGILISSLY